MHLAGTRSVKTARQMVWDTLQDPGELAACMPGCEGMTEIGPDQYEATMMVKVAAIGGKFHGRVSLGEKAEPDSFQMRVEGGGGPGRVNGTGTIRLEERDGGTEIAYDGNVQVAGPIAAVGQRLLGASARMMIGKFFDCLEQRLTSKE
jgi:carbon monoxide dehydrogenase subunit G